MLRKSLDRRLNSLNERIVDMGKKVELQIHKCIEVLKSMDKELALEVYKNDEEINHMEHQAEQYCLNLLALEQPLAGDLRMVAGSLKIITDMERIGDQCADICEIISSEQINLESKTVDSIIEMLSSTSEMFSLAMQVFENGDVEESRKLCKQDDKIDEMFEQIVIESTKNMVNSTQKALEEVDLIFIAKYVERIGDHCTNIAEWVIYIQTGKHPDLNQ